MAIKYNKRRKHNSGTTRSSYNNKTGHTRHTNTVRHGSNLSVSRSVNKNGTTRITKTRKTAAGIVRESKTFGNFFKRKKKKDVYSGYEQRKSSFGKWKPSSSRRNNPFTRAAGADITDPSPAGAFAFLVVLGWAALVFWLLL